MNNPTSDDKVSNPFMDSVKQAFNTGAETISNASNAVTSQVDPSYSSYFNNNYLYIGLLLVVIVCIIIAVVLYKLITTKLFLNVKNSVEETRVPIICNQKNKFDFIYDKTGNGERRTYTFWIYIHDMSVYYNNFKHVFSIREGEKDTYINNCAPCIFLDKTQNRMYVFFGEQRTGNATPKRTSPDISDKTFSYLTNNDTLDNVMQYGITIPYIPLQRWVHVAIVCNANSYKNYVYAYIDGDLVNTTSDGETDKYITTNSGAASTKTKDFKNLDINTSGILITGGTANDTTNGSGFSGLISKVTTFNYELNQKDVFEDYYSGPIGGALARIGLGMYGFRSPIYKL